MNRMKRKNSKNVSIMRRVKHLLINSTLYSLYSTLVMPYLNYFCEICGNTYKSRIHPLHIIQKRAICICQNADYRSHSRTLFYKLKTLNAHDVVNFKSKVFMYNVYNKLLHCKHYVLLQKTNACHNHNVRMKNCNFKIRFSRTTKTSECMSVKRPKMWNHLSADIRLWQSG